MKTAQDLFSKHASTYKRYRPSYPDRLYELILSNTAGLEVCWDVGCGNGQVAARLADAFDKVEATDLSEHQIALAEQRPNIHYQVGRAERTNFRDHTFVLITVGQAVHWFDHEAFNQEVMRVMKPGGTVAVWCYELLKVSPVIDAVIWDFYKNKVGGYWAPERKFIDEHYATIPFPFEEVRLSDEPLLMPVNWTLEDLEGYLTTWSSVQQFIKEKGVNPVNEVVEKLAPLWEGTKEVIFPIHARIGKT